MCKRLVLGQVKEVSHKFLKRDDMKHLALTSKTTGMALLLFIFVFGTVWADPEENCLIKGIHANTTKNYDEATQVLEKCLNQQPFDERILINLGIAYCGKGMYDEAISIYKKIISLSSWIVDVPLIHVSLGDAYAGKGLLDEAIEEYKIAITLKPSDVNTHINLGAVYKKRGLLDKAIDEYKKALDLDSKYLDGEIEQRWYKKAEQAVQAKNYKEAIKCYEKSLWIPRPPILAPMYRPLRGKYINEEMNDRAMKEFEKAIELDPDNAITHYGIGIGILYYNMEMYDEAIAEFRKAIAINPDYAAAHVDLGATYFQKGMIGESIEEYKKAIEIDSNDMFAHRALCLIYNEENLYNPSIIHCKKAITLESDPPLTNCILGNSYVEIQMYDDAIDAYKKCMTMEDKRASANLQIGICYSGKSLFTVAADYFYNAGLLYLEEGNIDKAIRAYEALQITGVKELEAALFTKLWPTNGIALH